MIELTVEGLSGIYDPEAFLSSFSSNELNKVLYGEAAPRGPNPYAFIYHLLTEKVPLSCTFHRKLYPFHIPTEQLFLHFSLEKPLKNT